jgi:hypothetical protein
MIGTTHADAHIRMIFHKLMSAITLCDGTIQNVAMVMAKIEKSTACVQF